MPKRIQRKRIKGWRLPENTVCINRPTRWGNPFKVGQLKTPMSAMSLDEVLLCYETYLKQKLEINPNFLTPLRGKDLACFCKENEPCHGDILIKYSNLEK